VRLTGANIAGTFAAVNSIVVHAESNAVVASSAILRMRALICYIRAVAPAGCLTVS
jgi:hypothetical protein